MILAEWTSQIATIASRRQDVAAGVESSQWFFLDGIQRECGNPAVIAGDHAAAFAYPRPAKTCMPLGNVTMVKTNITSRHDPYLRQKCLTTSNR